MSLIEIKGAPAHVFNKTLKERQRKLPGTSSRLKSPRSISCSAPRASFSASGASLYWNRFCLSIADKLLRSRFEFLSAQPLRTLRLCGEYGEQPHRRGAEDAETAQRVETRTASVR